MLAELQQLGFKEHEAEVYLALLQLGPSTTGPVIKKTGLYRVLVYDVLNKLLTKGLVTYTLRRNRKQFSAVSPKQLITLAEQNKLLAKQIAGKLSQMEVETPLMQGAFVYEGWRGIQAAQENYFKVMKKGKEEYLMIGASRKLHKKLDDFFNMFHERRSQLHISAKLLFNENNKIFAKKKSIFKPVQIRFMPKQIVTPSWISTYGDMVLIGVSEAFPMAFLIKNASVAESYQQYFYFMWERSKEI